MLRHLSAALIISCLTSGAAFGFQPMAATVRVSGGSLYDYVIVGEDPGATDGFDNAYDTISPGNLNADMGSPFVSAVVRHPEWSGGMKEFRGDVRSPAARQEWRVSVSSSLAAGTPLTVTLQEGEGLTPGKVRLTAQDPKRKKRVSLPGGSYLLPAPGPGGVAEFLLTVEQQ